jgi:hypothetical protein
MRANKRWTNKEILQIQKNKKTLTIARLMELHGLTRNQIMYALYHHRYHRHKPKAAPKLKKAPFALFSLWLKERWFGKNK